MFRCQLGVTEPQASSPTNQYGIPFFIFPLFSFFLLFSLLSLFSLFSLSFSFFFYCSTPLIAYFIFSLRAVVFRCPLRCSYIVLLRQVWILSFISASTLLLSPLLSLPLSFLSLFFLPPSRPLSPPLPSSPLLSLSFQGSVLKLLKKHLHSLVQKVKREKGGEKGVRGRGREGKGRGRGGEEERKRREE